MIKTSYLNPNRNMMEIQLLFIYD